MGHAFSNTYPPLYDSHSAVVVDDFFYAFVVRSGHDCGLYVMAFMDVLSIRTAGLYFDTSYVRHMRDLCLLSILQGKVAHFPDSLEGMYLLCVVFHIHHWQRCEYEVIALQGSSSTIANLHHRQ